MKEFWMAWSDDEDYIASLYGSYEERQGMVDALARATKEDHRVAALRPVRVTVHTADGEVK